MILEVRFEKNLLQNFIRIQNDGFNVKIIDDKKIEIYNIDAFGLDPDYDEKHRLLMFKDNEEHYSRIPADDVIFYQLYNKDNK